MTPGFLMQPVSSDKKPNLTPVSSAGLRQKDDLDQQSNSDDLSSDGNCTRVIKINPTFNRV